MTPERIAELRGQVDSWDYSQDEDKEALAECLDEIERLNTGPRIIHAKDCEWGPMSSCTCAAGLGDGP